MNDDRYESVLLVIRECTAYRIPPRSSAKGYKAGDWDVNSFLWKGRMRVIAKGDDCYINLEDSTTGELFAMCPYPPDGTHVEPVLDSSRYFVLTLVDPTSGRKAFIGMGFQERSDAFDFNVALQDHIKRVKNIGKPVISPKSNAPAIDFSLKEDQKFSINIGGLNTKKKESSASTGSSEFTFLPPPPSGTAPFIPPPPAPTHTHAQQHQHHQQQSNDPFALLATQQHAPSTNLASTLATSGDDWANFGDFQAAPNNTSNASGSGNTSWWLGHFRLNEEACTKKYII
ncbi:adaptin ear-binding coat-associated protein 2-like protein [Obelidium mucronatum]|nr:adaptin ear-binding coat-associated protein 2-like protein [Obelidium mucronatum]